VLLLRQVIKVSIVVVSYGRIFVVWGRSMGWKRRNSRVFWRNWMICVELMLDWRGNLRRSRMTEQKGKVNWDWVMLDLRKVKILCPHWKRRMLNFEVNSILSEKICRNKWSNWRKSGRKRTNSLRSTLRNKKRESMCLKVRRYQRYKSCKLTQVTSMKRRKKLRVSRKITSKLWKKLQGLK